MTQVNVDITSKTAATGNKPPIWVWPKGSFDPSKVNYALIVMEVMQHVGMSGIEWQLKKLAKEQKTGDGVRQLIFRIMQLLSEIEGSSGSKGDPNVKADVTKLASLLKSLVGKGGFTDKDGKITAGGALGQLLASLGGGKGVTVVKMIVGLLKSLDGAFGKGAVNKMASGKFDMKDMEKKLNELAEDNYYKNNPTKKRPKDLPKIADGLNVLYNSAQSAQTGLQGLSSQVTAKVQQESAEMNSETQTGQQMVQIVNQAEKAMVNNQRSN